MEEERQVEVHEKLVDNSSSDVDSIPITVEGEEEEILINGNLNQERNGGNKEEEVALDGEFIKVEDSLDVKGSSDTDKAAGGEDNPSALQHSSSNSMERKEFLEAQEKMKTLELELEKAARELEHSQSEKARLQEEVVVAKEKLEERDKHCEELELAQKRLQEQIREVEENCSQLSALQEALGAQESKQKDLCNDLETRLKLSDDNFRKSDELLSQALSHNTELEQKLKSLEELHQESGVVAATATQRNLELEDIIQSSTAAKEEAKSQMREFEMQLISSQERVTELEQHLNMAELKSVEADKEIKEFREITAELTAMLRGFEEESVQLKSQLQEYADKLKTLEDQAKVYQVVAVGAAEREAFLKGKLDENSEKLVTLENTIDELKSKVMEAESISRQSFSETELLAETNLKLKLELETYQIKVNELQELLSSALLEKEGLAEANLKLTQELAEYKKKMNEIEMMLNTILVEKEETVEQLHSSKKTIEDLTQQLASEGQRLQLQISSVMEENNVLTKTYHDTKEELQTVIIQLEGQLNEQKARESSLNADMENLKAEITEKSGLQTHIEELEQQLMLAETRLKEEVESIREVAAVKEAGIASKLEDHVRTRGILDEQVVKLQEELNIAHATIAEQKEAYSRKDLEREADLNHSGELEKKVEELEQKLQLSDAEYKAKGIEEGRKFALVNEELDNLKNKLSQTVELENKVVELENKLKLAHTKSEDQGEEGIQAELKERVEVKSREFGSDISTPPKRKSKKRTEATPTQATEAASTTSTQTKGPSSSGMKFQLILGVAMVSVITGVILGKRY
ncbi:uncharacterized protein LOC143884707 [Tasmannia lanceolata]|uniref:uncharacterized protein LOC143884707 n=1 Tax=Tasmannia lanceolata TaxID=3420 RepID=UPI0040637B37